MDKLIGKWRFLQTSALILLLILTGLAPWVEGAASMPQRATCLVMPGEPVKKKFFADYQGKRYYFCCRPCVKAFKKNPEKYLAAPGMESPSEI